jgi:hypothetical protein
MPLQAKPENKTGLPDNLKSGVEALSGYSMNDVRVHYNSPKPAQLQALAYTQGTDIHVAPDQERHLPHEAWHVVQQMQGRVQPTMRLQGMNVNDEEGLEHEADVMGGRVIQQKYSQSLVNDYPGEKVVQRKVIEDAGNGISWNETSDKEIIDANGNKGWYRYQYDSKCNINDFTSNITSRYPKGNDPVDHSSRVNLRKNPTSIVGVMRSGKEVDIVGATRAQHFSIADGAYDIDPNYRRGKYTWHHLTKEYEMELVDMQVHNDFFHYGGVSFWT